MIMQLSSGFYIQQWRALGLDNDLYVYTTGI